MHIRRLLALTSLVAAAVVLPSHAAGQTYGGLHVSNGSSVRAGTTVTVSARLSIYSGPSIKRTCRLTIRSPGLRPIRVKAARTVNRQRGRVGWRVALPATMAAETWYPRVVCIGAGRLSDEGIMFVSPARRRVLVSETQLISSPSRYSTATFIWSARISNNSRFEIHDGDVRAVLRDGVGRAITTDQLTDAVTLGPGETAVISGSELVEGETPSSVEVSVEGDVVPRRIDPIAVNDLRLVPIPAAYDGDQPDLRVRAEVTNLDPAPVESNYRFITVFDSQGRLLASGTEAYPGSIAGGGTATVDEEIGEGLWVLSAARADLYWPARPD